jgi:hypothetical protein
MHGPQSQVTTANKDAVLLPPMERVEAVRSHWGTLSDDERADILSVSLLDLRGVAAEMAQSARTNASKRIDTGTSSTRNASVTSLS